MSLNLAIANNGGTWQTVNLETPVGEKLTVRMCPHRDTVEDPYDTIRQTWTMPHGTFLTVQPPYQNNVPEQLEKTNDPEIGTTTVDVVKMSRGWPSHIVTTPAGYTAIVRYLSISKRTIRTSWNAPIDVRIYRT